MKKYAALILEKKGKFLVEKRKSSKKLDPGCIVFPAGRIEEEETNKEAVIREAKEELEISIQDPFLVYTDIFEGKKIYWFGCKDYTGEIKMNEAAELIWLDPAEQKKLSFQNSRDALNKYLKTIKK